MDGAVDIEIIEKQTDFIFFPRSGLPGDPATDPILPGDKNPIPGDFRESQTAHAGRPPAGRSLARLSSPCADLVSIPEHQY